MVPTILIWDVVCAQAPTGWVLNTSEYRIYIFKPVVDL